MSPRGTSPVPGSASSGPGQLPGRQVKLWKAQHIGGTVHLPHLPVDGMDVGVVGQQHVHLTGKVHSLCRQGGADDLSDQGAVSLAGSAGDVSGNRDIVPLGHHFRPFPPFLAFSYSS